MPIREYPESSKAGEKGEKGEKGEAGVGVPAGGAANEGLIWEAAGKAAWSKRFVLTDLAQKITSSKTFEAKQEITTPATEEALNLRRATPAPAPTGETAGALITFNFPAGGEGTAGSAGSAIGLEPVLGAGGLSKNEGVEPASGGFGGSWRFTAGKGGEAVQKGAGGSGSATGGGGGEYEAVTGPGGRAITEGSGLALGG